MIWSSKKRWKRLLCVYVLLGGNNAGDIPDRPCDCDDKRRVRRQEAQGMVLKMKPNCPKCGSNDISDVTSRLPLRGGGLG